MDRKAIYWANRGPLIPVVFNKQGMNRQNMKGILNLFNGWKTVLGYLLLSIPGLTDNPMLFQALKAVIAAPTKENATAAVIQLILAIGIVDRIRKNLAGIK